MVVERGGEGRKEEFAGRERNCEEERGSGEGEQAEAAMMRILLSGRKERGGGGVTREGGRETES